MKTAHDLVLLILGSRDYWRKMPDTYVKMFNLSIDMIWKGEY